MNTRTVLVLLAAMGAVAMPAITIAATGAENRIERERFDADLVLRRLQDRGVPATSVEEWNNLIRAFVEVDGSVTMQYFDPDTLEPVNV
jgi:CCR4-NOT transcriptional regulation complex NOT5 subunit